MSKFVYSETRTVTWCTGQKVEGKGKCRLGLLSVNFDPVPESTQDTRLGGCVGISMGLLEGRYGF